MSKCECNSCKHVAERDYAERLRRLVHELNPDERAVLMSVAEGLVKGREVYGPLNASTEKRDMPREAFEEIRDGLIYLGVKMVQLERQ